MKGFYFERQLGGCKMIYSLFLSFLHKVWLFVVGNKAST